MDASNEPYQRPASWALDGHVRKSATSPKIAEGKKSSALRPVAKFVVTHVNRVTQRFGVEIKRFSPPGQRDFDNWMYYANLLQAAWARRAATSTYFETAFINFCVQHHRESKSQIFQDLLVLFLLGEKRNGFFVEFGATNGISLSNSFLLEKSYGWRGILAEPARVWHKALKSNRQCIVDTRCVWWRSGDTLEFNEAYESELSTINQYTGRDNHAAARATGSHYKVETISLTDLLKSHNAPREIDYISIDTEGSEYAILKNFDFADFDIGIVTVEHNYAAPDRENIAALLQQNGYERIFEEYSLFDDWYVQKRLLSRLDPRA